MMTTGIEVLKWGGGIAAGIVAFFTLKKIMVSEIEAKLKLRIDLVHAESDLIRQENAQFKLAIIKIEKEAVLKLSEKEHGLICSGMQQQIQSLEDCVKKEFEILHRRMNRRRKGNGVDTPTKQED